MKIINANRSKSVRLVASIGLLPTIVTSLGKDVKGAGQKFVTDIKDEMTDRKTKIESLYPAE